MGHWETTISKVFDQELATVGGVKTEETATRIKHVVTGLMTVMVTVRGSMQMPPDPYGYAPYNYSMLTHTFSLQLHENIFTYARINLMIGDTYAR